MMSNAKKASGFSKVRKLITVLQKCNGSQVAGGKDALVSPGAVKALIVFGLLFSAGAVFALFFFIEPFIAPFLPVAGILQAIMLIVLLISFILSVKNTVNVLYSADDLTALLPMPFTAGQIVSAKLAVVSKFPVGLSLFIINSVGLGLGIRAGLGAAFIIGTLLSSIMIPVTGIALAALLVVVVFRIFGFIRNRDITVVLGGIFTLLLTGSYIFLNNKLSRGNPQAAAAVFSTVASVSSGFPNIAYMSSFMFEGNVAGLFIGVGITIAVTALAMLAVKLFYFSTALSMQNTGTSRKAVNINSLAGRKSGALKALTAYESRNTRRNPAYMVYGFAMTFVWPALVILPTVLGNNLLSNLKPPLSLTSSVICALSFAVTASCFSCGFNILAVSAFSREGSAFSAIKSLPIEFNDYYKSKRNFAMLICSLGSVLYILILGIVCVVSGFITPVNSWVIVYASGICFLLNLILINLMLLKNSRKPYFDWDSETEISRKLSWVNITALVIGVFALIIFFISLAFSSVPVKPESVQNSTANYITVAVTAVGSTAVIIATAVLVNRFAIKKAEANMEKLNGK